MKAKMKEHQKMYLLRAKYKKMKIKWATNRDETLKQ